VEIDFLVADNSRSWHGGNSDLPELLRSRGLYKSLSLALAHREGINVPSSLLLLALRNDLIELFANEFRLPLMIRVDYQSRPNAKPLGGIQLRSLEIIDRVCANLFNQACLPLLHPNLDRFEDVFSVGVLLTEDNDQAEFEVVGKGFDAGDLRLGEAIPHESFAVSLDAGTVHRHWVIDDEVYRQQSKIRRARARKLRAYTDFVNKSGQMLSDLSRFDDSDSSSVSTEIAIPVHYDAMPQNLFGELVLVIRRLKSGVLRGLPKSKVYVASLSCLPNGDWVLWDVYGDWYFR
jgi:hypothetical protein